MKTRLRVSRAGIELIETFEGLRTRSARLPGGRYVVGYGHTRSTRQGVEVSHEDAEALLIYDLMPIEAAVNDWTFAPLTQNQFDALVSFAFNIGLKSFRRSNVLRFVNQGLPLQAAGALEMWRQVDLEGESIIVDALVRRRAAEKALFLTPPEGFVAAPSAVLRPKLDFSAYMSVPRKRVERVHAPLDGDTAVARRTPSEDAPEWSAPLAAAAALSDRLDEILAEDAPPEPNEAAFEIVPETQPFPAAPADVAETAEDELDLEPFPEASQLLSEEDEAETALEDSPEAFGVPAEEARRTGSLMLLGLVGLGFVVASLVAFVRTPPEGAFAQSASPIAWVLGLVGLALIGGALWLLLGREQTAVYDELPPEE